MKNMNQSLAALFAIALLFGANALHAQAPKNHMQPWTQEQEATLRDAVSNGESVEQIAQKLERTPAAITARVTKLGLTPATDTPAPIPVAAATPIATPPPAPVASVGLIAVPSPTPAQRNAKKILVGAYRLNHVDLLLIDALKAKGYEVVLTGPEDINKYKIDVTWDDKSKPPASVKTREGSVKATYKNGTFPIETLKEYSAFIFADADTAHDLQIPMDQILRSGKLVVFGEAPNMEAGEKLLAGKGLSGRYTPNSYDINSGIKRISYVVYASSWKKKKFPTEEDNQKFVTEQLLPRVLSNL